MATKIVFDSAEPIVVTEEYSVVKELWVEVIESDVFVSRFQEFTLMAGTSPVTVDLYKVASVLPAASDPAYHDKAMVWRGHTRLGLGDGE